jgi:hypothetical protein
VKLSDWRDPNFLKGAAFGLLIVLCAVVVGVAVELLLR